MTQVDEGPESPEVPGVLTFGTPTVGEVLAERYELQEHINDDAFGRQVWRGVDVILRRPVAVVMRYPGGEAAIEMLDAAVAASRVVHPHLVDVYDAIDEGNRAYVVRETVLIGTDGRVVLSDARADEATTPDADIRAIGAVLYCALTGHWPHAEAGASSLPDAVRDESDHIIPPRQVRGGVPGHLSDLATDLLDPSVAPPSADVLAADLSRLEGDREEAFFSVGAPLLDFDEPGYPGTMVPERHRSVRKLVIGVAVLLVLSLVGLLVAINALGGPRHGGGAQPTGGTAATAGTGQPKGNGNPTRVPVAANQVRIVDPPNGNRDPNELSGAQYAIDNDLGTAWHSAHYKGSPEFGQLKPGMGILIDLGAPKQVADVQVTASAGAMIDLRTGTSDPGPNSGRDGDKQIYDTFRTVGDPKTVSSTTVFQGPTDPVRYLMVFISKLPPIQDNGGYYIQVQDIQVHAKS
ncbi:MAG: hypothetical protein AUI10_07435 [Actinobacteria bacterium 13_2_20CM_2_72_6]|nr:MAG: hypothetical protein AUI10_07435 [Actinobacteria bacterium 13_2_20CM_2_72_6]